VSKRRKIDALFIYYLLSFNLAQSSRNLFIPMSVSGCCMSFSITAKGTVAMSAPVRPASTKCKGCLIEATIICVLIP